MKTATKLFLSVLFWISLNANAQNYIALNKQIQEMNKVKNPNASVLEMKRIIKDFKLDSIKNAEDIDVLKGQVAISFLNANDFSKFETYISLIKNKFNQTSYLNMAVYALLEKKNDDDALLIAKKTVDLYESFKDNPKARPISFPLEDWTRFMQMAAYPYYESYAEVLFKNGQYQNALLYEEKAIKDRAIEDLMPKSIELYTALLEKNGQIDKAYNLLLKMYSLGKASLKMNAQLKTNVINKLGTEAKAVVFLDSIQRDIDNIRKIEIKKNMISNVDAPNFNLLDLNGKSVSLIDFRGKIVVLDFWATWCTPCIASMPAMKQISTKHPEVVFLFIATQEPINGATERVKTYVSSNKFPTNVVLDKAHNNNPKVFPIANAYKISSIPAKIVIDKTGKLRFSTYGYRSDSELIDELEAMIAIVKAQ